MDRRDSMPLPGSAPYFMQSVMPEIQGRPGICTLSYATIPFQSNIGGNSSGHGLSIEPEGINVNVPCSQPSTAPIRRKRGRPRKYGPEGVVSLALSPLRGINSPIQRRGRGRPPGTGRKQQPAAFGGWLSSSAGIGFTPHVILITAGEDIASKVLSFAQQGSRSVCIMSANGAVSTVTLRQPSSSVGTVTYEGRFDILSISGSFLLIDNNGSRSHTGCLSISLASPDGHVIGGGVGGMLIAASPVQVILGSFEWGNSKTKQSTKGNEVERDAEHGSPSIGIGGQTSLQQQSQTATSSSMGAWSSPQAVHIQNSHFDIDLMHG